jgi:hypothetical protein
MCDPKERNEKSRSPTIIIKKYLFVVFSWRGLKAARQLVFGGDGEEKSRTQGKIQVFPPLFSVWK